MDSQVAGGSHGASDPGKGRGRGSERKEKEVGKTTAVTAQILELGGGLAALGSALPACLPPVLGGDAAQTGPLPGTGLGRPPVLAQGQDIHAGTLSSAVNAWRGPDSFLFFSVAPGT